MKVKIKPSPTADTRTCDYANTSKETLYQSSVQHIKDVQNLIETVILDLDQASQDHDWDKLDSIDQFHKDFVGGFESTVWWDEHRRINRHHLAHADGVPEDVNLVDVIEYIADCLAAGFARDPENMYDPAIGEEVLMMAFKNTIQRVKSMVELDD